MNQGIYINRDPITVGTDVDLYFEPGPIESQNPIAFIHYEEPYVS